MLQITEDTPPDMLAGAMDLTVHLPSGRSVKMAVERSTPMMDLLVQITTNHHLHLSNYTLQALGMAPSSEHSDKILPYKPNTPIGTLDTQHIKVIPKSRSIPVPKNIPPGHQPFESTFRLKVHLPRNQLYVTRVSRNVLLEDIMKKVCEEKNLDPLKYEFKHPGNLDEVLDPKLTLSDYQITEIYVVLKGTASLNQAFSTSDIMALRKEEERKQMHNKTGGGVFNLIFRRGKSSMGSGSISSDTRSISPTHSDDSRSVTPPAVQQQIITPPKKESVSERPKPPQRKRRPAPKPPQNDEGSRKNSVEKPPSNISETENQVNELQSKRVENGLTICHSRNSSDSSGYHEASVLSENGNTSLPRRPKSAFVTGGDVEKISKMHSQSTTNLAKMTHQSKSTTSLGIAGRKKKAAPPPPPVARSSNSDIISEIPSPVVASQPITSQDDNQYLAQENTITHPHNPVPTPRNKTKAPPKPLPRREVVASTKSTIPEVIIEPFIEKNETGISSNENVKIKDLEEKIKSQNEIGTNEVPVINEKEKQSEGIIKEECKIKNINKGEELSNQNILIPEEIRKLDEESKVNISDINSLQTNTERLSENVEVIEVPKPVERPLSPKSILEVTRLQKSVHENIFSSPEFLGENRPPEVIAMIPKTPKETKESSKFDSFGKRRFQIGSSLTENFDAETASINSRQSNDSKSEEVSTRNSVDSALESFNFGDDEFSDIDETVFVFKKRKLKPTEEIFNQLFGIHNLEDIQIQKDQSISSLRSLQSLPGFLGSGSGMKKWSNIEDLDDISLVSVDPNYKWVVGETSDAESISTNTSTVDNLTSITSIQSTHLISEPSKIEEKSFDSTDSGISQDNIIEKQSEIDVIIPITPPPPPDFVKETETDENIIPPPILNEHIALENFIESKLNEKSNENFTLSSDISPLIIQPIILSKSDDQKKEITEEIIIKGELEKGTKHLEVSDIDWQYQLPSPPKAFRDSSPANFTDTENLECHSVTDFKDSVVTSPELFEKLKAIEDTRSEKDTINSDLASIVSEEEKPLLNKLSLEHLEKRKSLVYNRELATSLKMTDTIETKAFKVETFSSSLTQFESTYEEIKKSSLPKETNEPKYQQPNISSHTLPNFKISTYDCPKQKIKVFEDDTIRSNTDNKVMKLIQNKLSTPTTSVENIRQVDKISNIIKKQPEHKPEILSKQSSIEETQRPPVPVKTFRYRGPPSINMGTWSERPKVPVGIKEDADYKLGNTNVSSKLIVNTTNNNIISNNSLEIKNTTPNSRSQSTPLYGNGVNIKINGTDQREKNNVSIKVNGSESISSNHNTGNVIIKIGSMNSENSRQIDNHKFISHTTAAGYRKPFSNVNKNQPTPRPHSIAFGSDFDISRVPVVRSVELKKPYKEMGNTNNTSVTQIYQGNNVKSNTLNRTEPVSELRNKFSNLYRSSENLTNGTYSHSNSADLSKDSKPVFRVHSFKPNIVPVVRGFKTMNDNTKVNNRLSWNPPTSYSTLPAKPKETDNYSTNRQVPFSQLNLKRTESHKLVETNIDIKENKPRSPVEINNEKNNTYNSLPSITKSDIINSSPPPPPPLMPKVNLKKPFSKPVEQNLDPRDQLLAAIRNFGGKKGLRAVKAH